MSFFLVKIDVLQIDESAYAPDFDVVSQPNDWAKAMRHTASGELSETKLLQLSFWTKFREFSSEKTRLSLRKPSPQHWYDISMGSSKCHISLTVNTEESAIGCEVYISNSKELFKKFAEKKSEIEAEVGGSLQWMELPGRQASRIKMSTSGDIRNESQWPGEFEWLLQRADLFAETFRRYL